MVPKEANIDLIKQSNYEQIFTALLMHSSGLKEIPSFILFAENKIFDS